MGNPAKRKGDRAEREALAVFMEHCPDLLVNRPERMLGAGRLDDVGDLRVLPDTTIQVKAYAQVTRALRVAATTAEDQRERADLPFAVGLCPIPRAPLGRWDLVRWLAVALHWPDPEVLGRSSTETFNVTRANEAIAWLRDPQGEFPISERAVELVRSGMETLVVAPVQAWVADYRAATGRFEERPAA